MHVVFEEFKREHRAGKWVSPGDRALGEIHIDQRHLTLMRGWGNTSGDVNSESDRIGCLLHMLLYVHVGEPCGCGSEAANALSA